MLLTAPKTTPGGGGGLSKSVWELVLFLNLVPVSSWNVSLLSPEGSCSPKDAGGASSSNVPVIAPGGRKNEVREQRS